MHPCHRRARGTRVHSGGRGDLTRSRRASAITFAARWSTPPTSLRCSRCVIEPGDRVCLEGNNQKQADFLAKALTQVDPALVHDLHMVQSVLALPEHLDVFDKGIATRLDFSFSGPQARAPREACHRRSHRHRCDPHLPRTVRPLFHGPHAARSAGRGAGGRRPGNLYTGPNTEDTPVIAEATAFKAAAS